MPATAIAALANRLSNATVKRLSSCTDTRFACCLLQLEEDCKVECLKEWHAYKVCVLHWLLSDATKGRTIHIAARARVWHCPQSGVMCPQSGSLQTQCWHTPRPFLSPQLHSQRLLQLSHRRSLSKVLLKLDSHSLDVRCVSRQECAKRIESSDHEGAHCTGWAFDYWRCIDKCVSDMAGPSCLCSVSLGGYCGAA